MAPSSRTATRNITVAFSAAVLCLAAITIAVARATDPTRSPAATDPPTASPFPPPIPVPRPDPADLKAVGAVTTIAPTAVKSGPSQYTATLSTLRRGVILPVTGFRGPYLSVFTPCEAWGWVHVSNVDPHLRASAKSKAVDGATIVLDPGHGGQLSGAKGPGGFTEMEANLDIAKRLAGKLTGARAFLTRTGNYTAGLEFRSKIANRLGADLLLSIHNNAAPDGPSDKPGTETYYQVASPESKRLAGILYEELFGGLNAIEIPWMSDRDAGAKFRTNVAGDDFYGLLRRADVPTVIVEAMYISNAPEEELLRRAETRELIAAELAEGVGRFVTTEDPGSGFVKPLHRTEGSSGQLPSKCVEPS